MCRSGLNELLNRVFLSQVCSSMGNFFQIVIFIDDIESSFR